MFIFNDYQEFYQKFVVIIIFLKQAYSEYCPGRFMQQFHPERGIPE